MVGVERRRDRSPVCRGGSGGTTGLRGGSSGVGVGVGVGGNGRFNMEGILAGLQDLAEEESCK